MALMQGSKWTFTLWSFTFLEGCVNTLFIYLIIYLVVLMSLQQTVLCISIPLSLVPHPCILS